MKKSYFLMLVAVLCMFATGCNKDAKTIGRFVITEQGFVDPDSKMHFTWLEGSSSHLSYDNNDALKINGYNFTLHKSGTRWYAEEENHEDITASNFYSIYADPNMTITGSGPTYGFSYNFSGQIANTNGIILAGSTEDSMLTLKPACAILRFPAGQEMDYVRVGFSPSTIPSSGSLDVSSGTPSISATSYITGVASEGSGGFLEMINDGTDAYATYYVAVPIKNGSVNTQLFLTWKYNDSPTVYKYKTSGSVTLQQGKVYTVGKTRVAPFQTDGSSKSYFIVSATRAVRFSAGNLQYSPDNEIWRFAPNQYEAIGSNNNNISMFYMNWIDLFGFGCSGANYSPVETAETVPGNYDGTSTIATTVNDWGVFLGTNIYYGDNLTTSSSWRTLTKDEWNYLLGDNVNRRNLWGLATINGSGTYKGLVLIPNGIKPDGSGSTAWNSPCSFTPGGASGYGTNTYTADEWSQMEAAGAIFLPVTGYRTGTKTYNYNSEAYYWSTEGNGTTGYAFPMSVTEYMSEWYADATMAVDRYYGCAVRLVRNR